MASTRFFAFFMLLEIDSTERNVQPEMFGRFDMMSTVDLILNISLFVCRYPLSYRIVSYRIVSYRNPPSFDGHHHKCLSIVLL